MSWLNKLERTLKRFAIPNLMYYIITLNFITFVLNQMSHGKMLDLIVLDPARVMQGEVWRLISFAFIPPSYSLIFFALVLYFYYIIGQGLEAEWGSFRFNLYYLIGVLSTIGAAFIAGTLATSSYIYLSLFLAFAFIYPDYEIRLFFILPIKIKYLAWLSLAFIGYTVVFSPRLIDKLVAIAPIAGYLIFFGRDLWAQASLKRTVNKNRRSFTAKMNEARPESFHRCTVCGKTELTDPKMFFRYCSTCEGHYEYCEDHLKTHEHIKVIH